MLFNTKLSNLKMIILKLKSRFLEFKNVINSSLFILTNQRTNIDYSLHAPSIWKKKTSIVAIKINFNTIVIVSKITTAVINFIWAILMK